MNRLDFVLNGHTSKANAIFNKQVMRFCILNQMYRYAINTKNPQRNRDWADSRQRKLMDEMGIDGEKWYGKNKSYSRE